MSPSDLDLAALTPGQQVTVIVAGWRHTPMRTVEVVKVGKRDVTLSDGTKWNIARNRPSGERGGWYYLALPDSDVVRRAELQTQIDNVGGQVVAAAETLRQSWTLDNWVALHELLLTEAQPLVAQAAEVGL